MSANCEECVYYDYDEELAAYVRYDVQGVVCIYTMAHWAESQSTYSSRHRSSSVISRAASRPT